MNSNQIIDNLVKLDEILMLRSSYTNPAIRIPSDEKVYSGYLVYDKVNDVFYLNHDEPEDFEDQPYPSCRRSMSAEELILIGQYLSNDNWTIDQSKDHSFRSLVRDLRTIRNNYKQEV